MQRGVLPLFRVFGIQVYLHFTWFIVAALQVTRFGRRYHSPLWGLFEYLALFAIVLLHEFGHALACRQVGGVADRIVLWPLGGVAYVKPPPRPGATLWSIAAGPLVNVVLLPILLGIWFAARSAGWDAAFPDAYKFIRMIGYINFGLLVFNLLPIYPLDGGQILQSLLWFVFGRARSLQIATVIGFVGVGGLVALAVASHSIWIGILAFFVLINCWRGWTIGRMLLRLEKAPRRSEYRCPLCQASPPIGTFWGCGKCGKPFDNFETHATCPNCGENFGVTACVSCGRSSPIDQWVTAPPLPTS